MPQENELRRVEDGTIFVAVHNEHALLELRKKCDGTLIPPESQTFRRLANGNKGNRFQPLEQQHAST